MSIDRKQWILEGAKEAFSSYGYKATTMDNVAKIAKVGKGTIYLYFKSKEELFSAIIEEHVKEMISLAKSVISPGKSFFENANSALYAVLDFRMQQKFALKLLEEQREFGTRAVNEAMKTIDDAIVSFIKEKIELAIERGELKECNPEITAFVLLKLYIALIYEWEQTREPLTKEDMANLFELYFITGIKKS
ncbi:MAG: TetR/AcrR family transcriptional regulator [Bacillaceae bacterium]